MIFANAAKNLFEAIFGERFKQVIESVDFEGAKGVMIVCGDEDDGRHVVRADGFDDGETVARRHLHVKENEVRLEFFDRRDGGVAAGGFAEDLYAGLLAKKAKNFAARGGFVVNDQNF